MVYVDLNGQECVRFITILYKGQWRKEMNSTFNIITAVTYKIEFILKAVFEFMLSQMTKSKTKTKIRV